MPVDDCYSWSKYISPQLRKLRKFWKKHGTSILNKPVAFKKESK